MATLYAQTTSCLELFSSLAKQLESGPEEHRNKLPVAQVEDQAARLRVWASNLGALNTGHSALDHRLRDSTAIRTAIIRILDMTESILRISYLIVKGDRVPMEDVVGDYADTDEQDSSTDSGDSGSTLIDNELSFNLSRIIDFLSELHRLSFRIRNPGTRATAESTLKARLHREMDPHTGKDVFEQYAKEDYLRIKGLVADFHLQSGHELDHSSDYLIERASIANTNRRRCFSYWKAHASKLARVSAKPQVSMPTLPLVDETAPQTEIIPLKATTPHVAATNLVSEQKTTVTSTTEATKLAPNLDVDWDSKSQISYMSTTYDSTGVYSHPAPPHISSEAREYTCSYCHLTCPVKHFKGQAWRFPAVHLYLRRVSGSHISVHGPHRLERTRALGPSPLLALLRTPDVFGTESTVHHHLTNEHKELNASQIQRLLEMTVLDRQDERPKCSFCGSGGPYDVDFADHLACHMEKFAMIATPLDHDGDDTTRGSRSSVAMSGGDDSRLSLSSLSSFGSLVGGTEKGELLPPDSLANDESDPIEDFKHEIERCTRTSAIGGEYSVFDDPLGHWF
ncbi:hypothetical protein PG991_001907 [Apiospora marii]|uniref:Uncharacterized protein n=1 Tax=Apiospora marii TaxID=335849 RepID=A0ABR1SNF0_9PEZI